MLFVSFLLGYIYHFLEKMDIFFKINPFDIKLS